VTILLVDAGNSRLKWSELSGSGVLSTQYAQAYGDRPALAVFIDLLERYPKVTHITLVHVLTQLFADSIQTLCTERGIALHKVRSKAQGYGIQSGYQEPTRLGTDRFVGLVAAHQLARPQPCIVIDCGTAVTLDAIDTQGQHLGGVIFPGLQLSADALIARAQGKLSVAFDENMTVLADHTSQAIGSGCLFALVGAIEGISARMQTAFTQPAKRILTGGDATNLQPWLQGDYQIETDLLMQGLRYITLEGACITP
jgi:type III pantothenate kinase